MSGLAGLLSAAAAATPEGVALVDAGTGAETTWAGLDAAVDAVATGLGGLGCVAGNRAMLLTGNRPEFVVTYLAALRARLVAVPLNPRSATGELLRAVTESRPRVLVADATTLDSARAVVAAVQEALAAQEGPPSPLPRLVVLDGSPHPGETAYDDLLRTVPAPLPPARDPDALAVLLFTSGTSARPRAAMLSHRALLANLEQAAQVDPPVLRPDDVVYGVLPLFHVYGLNAVLGQVLRHGARLVLAEGFDPERALAEVEAHGVTVLPVAPPVLGYWQDVPDLAQRLAGVRLLLSGSAPLAPELVAHYAERHRITVHQGYGLTEAAPVVTSTLCSSTTRGSSTWGSRSGPVKPGSVGAALPGVGIRLVDEDGAAPAEGDPGEIEICGANLFDGYWPDGADGPRDGWWATGDVGYLDADGDLFLVDRVKEIVIVSGFNVYPTEVEDVLGDVDGVLEVAVVGEPAADTGEAVVAYVRADQGAGLSAEADEALLARVQEACDQRLARFKHPRRVELVAELPHTATGKVAKGRLRATSRRERLGLLE